MFCERFVKDVYYILLLKTERAIVGVRKGVVSMLQQQTMDIIKATAPVLEVHGVTITKTFYQNMFDNHPELLNIFNHTNQARGRQQTALANTVYAAAVHIENLEAILPVVVQIAHKHVSLGVLPAHYPIVGKYLLAAIKEVLGDAATPEILQAWEQAYGVIADIFIQVEEDLYKQTENDGGWRLFKKFKVVNKEVENASVTSFYLAPEDGSTLPNYLPGQYITIRTAIPGDTYLANRQYTLSQAADGKAFRISVKKENDTTPAGKVSNFLHDTLQVDDVLDVSAPAGVFTLQQSTKPVAFISGGIGVTPLHSMVQALEEAPQVSFIQCARNPEVVTFQQSIQQKMANLPNASYDVLYSDQAQYINEAIIAERIAKDADVYVCGPVPFMAATVNALESNGFTPEQIHYEFFGPALQL